MPRWASRTDSTHEAIREVLRECHFRVRDTSRLGGFVDLVVYRADRGMWLIDCKTPQNKQGRITLTPSQQELRDEGWPIAFLSSCTEAIQWATEVRECARHEGR